MSLSHLDDRHEESLLVLLMHGPGDGTDGPAECVEILPTPLITIHL